MCTGCRVAVRRFCDQQTSQSSPIIQQASTITSPTLPQNGQPTTPTRGKGSGSISGPSVTRKRCASKRLPNVAGITPASIRKQPPPSPRNLPRHRLPLSSHASAVPMCARSRQTAPGAGQNKTRRDDGITDRRAAVHAFPRLYVPRGTSPADSTYRGSFLGSQGPGPEARSCVPGPRCQVSPLEPPEVSRTSHEIPSLSVGP